MTRYLLTEERVFGARAAVVSKSRRVTRRFFPIPLRGRAAFVGHGVIGFVLLELVPFFGTGGRRSSTAGVSTRRDRDRRCLYASANNHRRRKTCLGDCEQYVGKYFSVTHFQEIYAIKKPKRIKRRETTERKGKKTRGECVVKMS